MPHQSDARHRDYDQEHEKMGSGFSGHRNGKCTLPPFIPHGSNAVLGCCGEARCGLMLEFPTSFGRSGVGDYAGSGVEIPARRPWGRGWGRCLKIKRSLQSLRREQPILKEPVQEWPDARRKEGLRAERTGSYVSTQARLTTQQMAVHGQAPNPWWRRRRD